MSTHATRAVLLLEAAWGMTLVLAPDRVIRFVQGADADPSELVVARVLGARHVLQAIVVGARPTRNRLLMGSAVNGMHATSLMVLGATDRSRRRIACSDGALAAVWCAMELLL